MGGAVVRGQRGGRETDSDGCDRCPAAGSMSVLRQRGGAGSNSAPPLPPLCPSSAHGLPLYLSLPGDTKVAVDLPADATMRTLRAAAEEAGGPWAARQVLSIGGQELRCADDTPLSEVDLMASEVTITVQRSLDQVVYAGYSHSVVLLEGGGMQEWGASAVECPPTEDVTAVCAGWGYTAAVVGGCLKVWGEGQYMARVVCDLGQLEGREIVRCSAYHGSLAAVTADGHLLLCGDIGKAAAVPETLQGCVVAAAVGFTFVVAATSDGTVHTFGTGQVPPGMAYFGGLKVVSISAGSRHYALVLADGRVLCAGQNAHGQCNVPPDVRDAVTCSCGNYFTVALCSDGTLSWWGKVPPSERIVQAGRIAAVSACGFYTAAVTVAGRLVADGDEYYGRYGLFDTPHVAVRRCCAY